MNRVMSALCGAVFSLTALAPGATFAANPVTLTVFSGDSLHFAPDHPDAHVTDGVVTFDNGREIGRVVTFPALDPAKRYRITGHLTTRPVPKEASTVCDPWDRSANVRLRRPGQPDLELIRHITAYGGLTSFDVDLSDCAAAFTGAAGIHAFIDTWLSPAWTTDFSITFEALADTVDPNGLTPLERTPDTWSLDTGPPARVLPVLYQQDVERSMMDDPRAMKPDGHARPDSTALAASVDIPKGTRRVLLRYITTGHCTDGRDDEEFLSKDNVIRVDGRVVHRVRPWRDDCGAFRAANPYCRRWSDGTWSSDYSRSNFCPGDLVFPEIVDLTDALTPGKHVISVEIPGIRPKGEDGALGYWRVSAALLEW